MRTLKTRKIWVTINAATDVPKRLTGFSAAETSMTCSGITVTVTTTRNHWMENGDKIVVSGASPSGYNGEYIVTVTSDTTFTYLVTVPLGTESGASFYVKKPIIDATIIGKKAPQTPNTGLVYIGTKAGDGLQPFEVAAAGEYYLTPPDDETWDLSDWYLDVSNASDGLVIFFS